MEVLHKSFQDAYYKNGLPSLLFEEFEYFFKKNVESDKKKEDFGSDCFEALCLVSIKLKFSKNMRSLCKLYGNMDAYEVVLMSQMGDSLKGTVLKERVRIEGLKGFAKSFMHSHGCFETCTFERP